MNQKFLFPLFILGLLGSKNVMGEIQKIVSLSAEVRVKTDDIPVRIEVAEGESIEISYQAPRGLDPEQSLKVSAKEKLLVIEARARKASWFEVGGSESKGSYLLVRLPRSGVRQLEVSTLTGEILAKDLPESIEGLGIDTVNARAEVLTSSSDVNYRTVTGVGRLDLVGQGQSLQISDVNGRTFLALQGRGARMDLKTRGRIHVEGYHAAKSLTGARSLKLEGDSDGANIEYSSISGDIVVESVEKIK